MHELEAARGRGEHYAFSLGLASEQLGELERRHDVENGARDGKTRIGGPREDSTAKQTSRRLNGKANVARGPRLPRGPLQKDLCGGVRRGGSSQCHADFAAGAAAKTSTARPVRESVRGAGLSSEVHFQRNSATFNGTPPLSTELRHGPNVAGPLHHDVGNACQSHLFKGPSQGPSHRAKSQGDLVPKKMSRGLCRGRRGPCQEPRLAGAHVGGPVSPRDRGTLTLRDVGTGTSSLQGSDQGDRVSQGPRSHGLSQGPSSWTVPRDRSPRDLRPPDDAGVTWPIRTPYSRGLDAGAFTGPKSKEPCNRGPSHGNPVVGTEVKRPGVTGTPSQGPRHGHLPRGPLELLPEGLGLSSQGRRLPVSNGFRGTGGRPGFISQGRTTGILSQGPSQGPCPRVLATRAKRALPPTSHENLLFGFVINPFGPHPGWI
ncbi:hypothetical protein M885DRAFT_206220 [Pelagophyceae sp. CCMP2097]|nr:hypothetical protein M885DRAFT_206220 [Pelagophyceae sp. CCMP2097]